MARKPIPNPQIPYGCIALEALSSLLVPVAILIWIFFTSAPSNSVLLSWLWITLVLLSISISLFSLVGPWTASRRWKWYGISGVQRAVLDLVRVYACAVGIEMLTLRTLWSWIRGMSSVLSPLGAPEVDILQWIVIGMGILILLGISAAVLSGLGSAMSGARERLEKAVKDS